MIHVLHVVVDLEAGGAERALANMVTSGDQPGVRHTILCLRKAGFFSETVRQHGVEVVVVGGETTRSLPKWIAAVRREVLKLKPDIVQGWMYYANLVALAGVQYSRLGRPEALPKTVWGLRCSDMDLSRYSRSLRMAVRLGSHLSQRPQSIVANSHAGLRFHQEIGFRNRHLFVIENGFDSSSFSPRESQRTSALTGSAEEVVVLTVARVDPMKDYPTLNEAAKAAKDASFFAIGLDTDTEPGLTDVKGLGRRSDVLNLLHGTDILVSASAYGEGMSNSIGEAMACGIPVVATDVGDAKRMLTDGNSLPPAGIIVPPGNPEALAGAVSHLANDVDLRHAMGDAGRQRILERYTMRHCHEAYKDLYKSLTSDQ